jgi:hypothetical protein
MTDVGWLFLYTPVPYLAALYLVVYRHDLGRLAKPFRDSASAHEWWLVCKCLGLIDAGVKPPTGSFMGGTRNPLLLIASTVTCATAFLVPFPLPWYCFCVIQAVAAVPLFVIVILSWTGPLPFKPYRDVLPYPRLGTRVRHLSYGEGEKGQATDQTTPAPARTGSGGAAP